MLINKNYSLLFSAYFISSLGDWLYRLAIPLLIFHLTHSALSMSIAYALTFLPYIIVTPLGGVIADRVSRYKLLVSCDFMAGIVVGLLALVFLLNSYSPFQTLIPIYMLIFFVASLTSLYHPGFQSYIPEIVPREKFARANSLISTTDNFILFLGPLLGGGIIASLGMMNAIYLNAISYFASALFISCIRSPVTKRSNATRMTVRVVITDLKAGLNCLLGNPIIKYGCLLFLFDNFGIQIFYANFMYFLVKLLHLTPTMVGVTIAITGIGAIIGSLLAPNIGKRVRDGQLILSCITLSGLTALLLLLTKTPILVASLWGLVSAFSSVIIVTYFTLRQRVIPAEFLGRTVALTRLISYTAIPIASIVGGWILQKTHDMTYIILISGVVMTLTGCLGWFTPLNRASNPVKQEIAVAD